MKVYLGVRQKAERSNAYAVYIEEDGTRTELTQRKRLSPIGFRWGQLGAGATELAAAILRDAHGEEVPPYLRARFTRLFVAQWPVVEGECWRITEDEVKSWLLPELHWHGNLHDPW